MSIRVVSVAFHVLLQRRMYWLPIFVLVILREIQVISSSQPKVKIDQGILTGLYERTLNNRQISAFLGIPYALPPTGTLRFEPPVPASKWTGILNATIAPPDCLQYSHLTYHSPYCPVTGSEDCLYLNIYTPMLFDGTDREPMDVIVYIHPGAWMYFSSSYQGPGILLDKDIVLVTFNFRLGPLGFLSTGDSVVPGNNGLKDQVLALKWVQKNIAAFGGNPKSVTIAGLSSGGASVHYHMHSPLSKGLFKHGISMSGSALCPWALAENVKEKTLQVAHELGCPTSDSKDLINCMKNRPAQHIVGLSKLFMPWLYNPYSPWGPVVEPESPNAFISASPVNMINKGTASDVPWLVTFTSDEGLYPAAEILGTESYVTDLEKRWEELLPFLLDYNYTSSADNFASIATAIKDHYQINLNDEEGKKNIIQMFSDRLYLLGISNAVKAHVKKNKSPVYMYEFSYKGKFSVTDVLTKFRVKEHYGVCHGDDVLYLMPMPWFSISDSHNDMKVSVILRDIWTEFASKGKLDWSPVNDHLPNISFINIKGHEDIQTIQQDSFGDEQFWNSLSLNEDVLSLTKDEL